MADRPSYGLMRPDGIWIGPEQMAARMRDNPRLRELVAAEIEALERAGTGAGRILDRCVVSREYHAWLCRARDLASACDH